MKTIEDLLKTNSISLSRFINLCLYKSKLGFYQKNRIGTHFTTSPEISQLFGECISIFFLLLLEKLKVKNFCELGPGNGTLTKDLINTMTKFLNKPISFYLYEKSVFLKKIQYQKLKYLNSNKIKINFLNDLKLKDQPIFFICNEFFDALPINQFKKVDNKWFERRVTFKKNLEIVNVKTNQKFSSKFKNGDVIELSPLSNLYFTKICRHISSYGGGALIFDYGPFSKKNIDTLQAIHNSKKCKILDHPLESDITYHVDFENLKRISHKFNLNYYGPITQKQFLFFHGINERVINLASKCEFSKKKELEKQFERLTSPSGMGDLIKCIFVSKSKINSKAFM